MACLMQNASPKLESFIQVPRRVLSVFAPPLTPLNKTAKLHFCDGFPKLSGETAPLIFLLIPLRLTTLRGISMISEKSDVTMDISTASEQVIRKNILT